MTMSMQEISDRLEIQDLMLRYSYAIDSRNWDGARRRVHPRRAHRLLGVRGQRRRPAEHEGVPDRGDAQFPVYQHMVSGTTITIHGDTAETKTQCHNPMIMGDADDPDLMMCGLWYVDKLVRTDDGWRIKERVEEKVYMRIFPGKQPS